MSTSEIYTLSLHDALPICEQHVGVEGDDHDSREQVRQRHRPLSPFPSCGHTASGTFGLRTIWRYNRDRKSTRLNSSHANIVCRLLLEKKNHNKMDSRYTMR